MEQANNILVLLRKYLWPYRPMKESQGLPNCTLKNHSIRILGKIIQCLGSALKYSCKNKNLNGRNKGNKNGRTVTTEARKWLHYTFLCFCVILKFSITLKVASILQSVKSLIFLSTSVMTIISSFPLDPFFYLIL